jgi:hypothetical protein
MVEGGEQTAQKLFFFAPFASMAQPFSPVFILVSVVTNMAPLGVFCVLGG